MAHAQFQKGQKVWVECVGAWAQIEKVQPVWAKDFAEPIKVTYDVGLGRAFMAHELLVPVADASAAGIGHWRLMRARNKWQQPEDCGHHPFPGTYPVVVTDSMDWGGWRVPGAEYDRDPDQIEFQARLIAAAPKLMAIGAQLVTSVDEALGEALPETVELARQARSLLKSVTDILAPHEIDSVSRKSAESQAA